MKLAAVAVAVHGGLALSTNPIMARGVTTNDFTTFIKTLLKNFAEEAPGVIDGVSRDNLVKITRGETPEVNNIFAEVVKGFLTRNNVGAVLGEFEKPDSYIDGIPSGGGVIIPFVDKALCGKGARNWFTSILCGSTTQSTHIGPAADGRGSTKVCALKAGYCVQKGLRTLCDDTKCNFPPGLSKVCFEQARYCVLNGKKVDCGDKKCDFNEKQSGQGDVDANAQVKNALKCGDVTCWSGSEKKPSKFETCAESRSQCGKDQIPFSRKTVETKLKRMAELEAAISKCPKGSCWGASTPYKPGVFVQCGETRDECGQFYLRSNQEVQQDLDKLLDSATTG